MATISYLHPHVETNIYDNSEVYVSTDSNGSVLFQPYFSERGISGEIEKFTDLGEFLKLKGIPNYRKYGQSQYNIVQWLQGGGTVYGIRLTDDYASYANMILNVQVAVNQFGFPIIANIDGTGNKMITRIDILDYRELKYKVEHPGEPVPVLLPVLPGQPVPVLPGQPVQELNEWSEDRYNALINNAVEDEKKRIFNTEDYLQTNINGTECFLALYYIIQDQMSSEPISDSDKNYCTHIDQRNSPVQARIYSFEFTDDIEKAVKLRWANFYLCLIRTKGKGSFGNRNAIRITHNNEANKTYDFKCYNLTVMESKENGTIRTSEGPIPISFYPDAMTNGGSNLSIQQVIIDYYMQIACCFNEDEYDRLISTLMRPSLEAPGSSDFYYYRSEKEIDFIFGDNAINAFKTNRANDLTSSTGHFLTGGGDGRFVGNYNKLNIEGSSTSNNNQPSNNNQQQPLPQPPLAPVVPNLPNLPDLYANGVVKEIVTSFFNASSGIYAEADIYNKKKYPFDVILDFNLPTAAKQSLVDFAKTRGDCIVCLDTGEQATPAKTVLYRNDILSVNDYLASIWSQMFTVYDTYTSSDIFVTPTYFLASKIPSSDKSYGIQYPFVGPNRGVITGFKKLNWTPNSQQKENLYDVKVNYVEQDNRITKFMSQLTSQEKTTSLSDINHVRCLLRIVRSVENLMENYIFELGTENTIAAINSALDATLSEWVSNGTCTTCTGNCSQTVLEAENKTAHVTLTIVFVDVIEKIVIDVNVTR